jgi:quercetin dioxygenase-like cupin family protein
VKRWDLRSLAPSSEKQRPREPGPDAPRVPRAGRQMPRVLFSTPECRAVVIDLDSGEELGEHHVRERAILEVIAGRVTIESGDETAECGTGTLVTFDPGEHHTIRALNDAQLLLLLTPWPGGEQMPANAAVEPIA